MELRFSHVDVLVRDLTAACDYYANLFDARISRVFNWERGGLHVQYAVVIFGIERFMLVQPIYGGLKNLLEAQGEGTIYRHCYSTPDIEAAYDELINKGIQPEDENGKPLGRNNLMSPSGARIIWLPKRLGNFSIEILQENEFEEFIASAF